MGSEILLKISSECFLPHPEIQFLRGVVGEVRYKVDRHQSPFCLATKVDGAFWSLLIV